MHVILKEKKRHKKIHKSSTKFITVKCLQILSQFSLKGLHINKDIKTKADGANKYGLTLKKCTV